MDRAAGMLKLARRLDHRFLVVRYDRRGYGRSADLPGPFSMRQQVDDLLTVLDGRRAVVVGHSYGGNIALAAAERHPDLVAAVATYEAPPTWLPWWPADRDLAGADPTTFDAAGLEPAERAERFMVALLGPERWAALPERTRAARRREGAALEGETRSLAAGAPWTGARIHVPVVVGVGERAAPRHRRGAEHLVAEIPGAERVELAGCGHDAPTSAPGLVAGELVARAARRAGAPWCEA